MFLCLQIVFCGVLFSICHSEILISIKPDSTALISALENVITRFYSTQTSNVFIAVQSSRIWNTELQPIEIAGKMIQMQSKRNNVLTYMIGDHFNSTGIKAFNVFVIDNYESFWYALIFVHI